MKLDLSVPLNKVGRNIIKNIVQGVVSSKQLNGNNYTPNAESTAKRKGFNKRLIGGGYRRFANQRTYKINKATPSKQEVSVEFKDDKDAEIGMYNQAPTGKGQIKKKDAVLFYAISDEMTDEGNKIITDYVLNRVDKEVKSWGYKRI